VDRRPELQLTAPGASPEEVAAIVGALELGSSAALSDALATARAGEPGTQEPGPWLRAALREGVDRGPTCE